MQALVVLLMINTNIATVFSFSLFIYFTLDVPCARHISKKGTIGACQCLYTVEMGVFRLYAYYIY